MASLNHCTFIGNLGRDPETKVLGNGNTVCNFSIACSESWVKDGEKQERTEWVRVQAWGKLAEICGAHLKKGKQVYVAGRLQTREYEKDGEKRYATEINASQVVFLGAKGDGQQQGSSNSSGSNGNRQQSGGYSSQGSNYGAPSGNDDIPF